MKANTCSYRNKANPWYLHHQSWLDASVTNQPLTSAELQSDLSKISSVLQSGSFNTIHISEEVCVWSISCQSVRSWIWAQKPNNGRLPPQTNEFPWASIAGNEADKGRLTEITRVNFHLYINVCKINTFKWHVLVCKCLELNKNSLRCRDNPTTVESLQSSHWHECFTIE